MAINWGSVAFLCCQEDYSMGLVVLIAPTLGGLSAVFWLFTSFSHLGRASRLVLFAVLIAAVLGSVPAYSVLDRDVAPLPADLASAIGASIGAIVGSLAGVFIYNRVRKPGLEARRGDSKLRNL